ncbi:MAG: hypothetical protein WCT32_05345 [Patescibacteria group bacterium]|jgi:hypothetical protein
MEGLRPPDGEIKVDENLDLYSLPREKRPPTEKTPSSIKELAETRQKLLETTALLSHPEFQRELYQFSKAIAEFIHRKQIPHTVLLDRSARPIYVGVIEYWRRRYQEEPLPQIHFVNPDGFKAANRLGVQQMLKVATDSMLKQDVVYNPFDMRESSEIIEEFQRTYHRLYADRDKPVLIMDVCSHSGEAIRHVKTIFQEAGFSNLAVATVSPPDDPNNDVVDLVISDREATAGCYPFGHDTMVTKNIKRTYSDPNPAWGAHQLAGTLRRNIKKVVGECYKLDHQQVTLQRQLKTQHF